MRTLIYQAAGGGLNGVPLEDTYDIIERAAQDYRLWTSDRGNPKDRKGVQDLCIVDGTNDIAELTNTLKMLVTEIKSLKTESAMKSSDVANVGVYCQICGSPSYFADGCPLMGQDSKDRNREDANYVGQNNQGAGFGNGSAANRWDNPNQNHPNLSYKPQNKVPSGFPFRQQQDNAPYQPRNQYNNQAHQQKNQNSGSYNNQNQPQQDQNSGSTSNMEAMLASFITEQRKTFDNQHRMFEEQRKASEQTANEVRNLQRTIEELVIHGRILENQIAQLANSANREHGKLPSKPDLNHMASVNAITLRGGKHIEMLPAHATRSPAEKSALDYAPAEEETSKEPKNRAENSAQPMELAPYRPPIPFPQRLKATRRDKEFKQFVDKIRTLYITMPFTDAITQISTYAQFMKEIMTGKKKIDGTETVALTEECSAALHQPMPRKLQDSGSFSIPCDIGGFRVRRALCDLGASVSIMPYSLYAKLNLGDLCPSNVTIHLADCSCRLPRGVLKDVPVEVKHLYLPVGFIVLDISDDVEIPIILGRPFLYTAKAIIDMDRGSIAL
ncbi:unnamed protein product [Rhodiola kirilowii]